MLVRQDAVFSVYFNFDTGNFLYIRNFINLTEDLCLVVVLVTPYLRFVGASDFSANALELNVTTSPTVA